MKPKHDPENELLRLSQAAQLVCVHPETLRRWADNGKVRFVRTPGGERRFYRDDLLEAVTPIS